MSIAFLYNKVNHQGDSSVEKSRVFKNNLLKGYCFGAAVLEGFAVLYLYLVLV